MVGDNLEWEIVAPQRLGIYRRSTPSAIRCRAKAARRALCRRRERRAGRRHGRSGARPLRRCDPRRLGGSKLIGARGAFLKPLPPLKHYEPPRATAGRTRRG